MESRQEPRAAWYQGLLGELCRSQYHHYQGGPFNMLLLLGELRRGGVGLALDGEVGACVMVSYLLTYLLTYCVMVEA